MILSTGPGGRARVSHPGHFSIRTLIIDDGVDENVLPAEHFIVAFLPFLAFVGIRHRRLPTLSVVGVVAVGSQFPDFIDKPLAHQFGILPSGRVFMHSLPTAIPFLLVVGYYGYKTERIRLASAFIFAHLSHLLADNYQALLRYNPQIPPDLFWPFTSPISRPITPHWAGAGGINVRLWTVFSIVVLSILVYMLVAVYERISPLSHD
jgi:hypothetical protein